MHRLKNSFALLAPLCLVAQASAQMTYTDDAVIPVMTTNWNASRTLDQFDPALGQLLSITLSADAAVSGELSFESQDAAPATVTLELSANVVVQRADNNAQVLGTAPSSAAIESVQAFDGTIDFGGPSGGMVDDLVGTASDMQVFLPPFSADTLNYFVGQGTFGVNVTAIGTSMASGPGNLIVQFMTNARSTITVTYEYMGEPDCDGDGIFDVDEIAMGSSDCNMNTIPDECEFDCNNNGIPDDCDPDECQCLEFNRRQPGSLLLYPEYRNGPGRVTLYTVTNANCDSFNGTTEVEFRYINGDTCAESNQEELLTPCDTFTYLTNSHNNNGEGYAYIYAKKSTSTPANPAGEPHVFNHLTGHMVVIDGWKSLDYSVNAVSFKGIGAQGTLTDRDGPNNAGDGIRDLNNIEYEPAPDRLYIPRFLGQDSAGGGGVHSDLILINLSGGSAFRAGPANPGGGTLVSILGYNDNEIVFSAEYAFSCWDRVPLSSINGAFNNTSLRGFNDDPNEIDGWPGREAGWFKINGSFANSTVESIFDPAIYAVLVEQVRGKAAADLPFEYCSQNNGDLLPGSIFGDYPFVVGDNQ